MVDNCSKIIKIVKSFWKHKKILLVAPMFISTMVLVIMLSVNNNETATMEDAVIKWYEQLPEDHWIKVDDDFNDIFCDIMDIEQGLRSHGKGFLNLFWIEMSYNKDYVSRFFAKAMQKKSEEDKSRYYLKYVSTNKNTKKVIRVSAGESVQVAFYCDKEEMLLDFSKEQYVNEIQCIVEDGKPDITNRIVFSYVEHPEIATIFNGKLVGLQKGKTKLHLCCNGYDIQYTIKVN